MQEAEEGREAVTWRKEAEKAGAGREDGGTVRGRTEAGRGQGPARG